MLTTKRLIKFLALFMAVALLLTACDRPFPGGDDEPTPTTEGYPGPGEEQAEGATPEPTREVLEEGETPPETEGEGEEASGEEASGEEVPGEEAPGEEVPAEVTPAEPGDGEETAEGGEGVPPEEEPGAEQPEAEAEATPAAEGEGEAEAPEPTQEAGEGESTGEPAPEGMEETQTAEGESSGTSAQPLPATHTVAAGENLYRIGLQYGMSWVAIARHNNIQNPNRIYAGQVLQIPGGDSGSGGQPEPVPTPEGINYIVKPGDTLFKIGQRFGISWTEIAEANGLVNPDQIYAGQTLKIPVDAPAPPSVVHHVVQPGETLFRISLQYGVPWLAIARANHISPPFYIFAGQTLVIPGGH
jgi:LysM repeat protein